MNNFEFKITGDPSNLVGALKQVEAQAKKVGDSIDASVNLDGNKGVKSFDNLISKFKEGQATASAGGGMFGSLAGTLGQLASPAGAATAALAGLALTFKAGIDAALAYDEIGDKLELSFTQAGLSGSALESQLKDTGDTALELALQFAAPADTFRNLSAQAAALGGATGQTNKDLVKLGFGIEKLTDGAVSGEAAIKVFTRGVADPTNADAIDKLKKKLPALGDALESGGTSAAKIQKALEALNPTFTTLQAQAGDAGSTIERFKIIGGEAFKQVAGTIYDKVSAALSGVADVLGTINFKGIIEGAKVVGSVIGEVFVGVVKVLKSIVSGIYNLVSPVIDALGQLFSTGGSATDWGETLSQVIGTVSDVFAGIADIFYSAFKPIVSVFVEVIKYITGFASSSQDAGKASTTFSDKIIGVRATIAGLIAGVKEAIAIISEMAVAFVHFDFSKIGDLLSGFGARVADTFKAKKDESYNLIKETQAQEDQLAADRKKKDAKEKKEKEKKEKSALALAIESFKREEAINSQRIDLLQKTTEAEEIARTKSTEISKDTKLGFAAQDVEEAKKKLEDYIKILGITLDAKGEVGTIGVKGDEKEFEQVRAEFLKLKTDIQTKYAAKYKIELASSSEDFKKQVDDITGKIKLIQDDASVKVLLELGKDEFDKQINKAKTDFATQIQAIQALTSVAKDSKEKENLNNLLSDLLKRRTKFETDLASTESEYADKRKVAALNAIEDTAQRELELKIYSIEKTRDKEIEEGKKIGVSTLAVEARYNKEIADLRAGSLKKTGDIYVDTFKTVAKNAKALLGDTFGTINDKIVDGALRVADAYALQVAELKKARDEGSKKATEDLSRITTETESLEKQLAKRSISLEEFSSRSLELERQAQETKLQIKTDGELALQALQDSVNSIASTKLAEFSKGQQDQFIQNASDGKVAFDLLASSYAGSVGAMIVSGQNLGTALGRAAFDALQSLVPILVAQITGISLAQPDAVATFGASAIARTAILTALLQAAVSAGRAALGFKDGVVDLQGKGTSTSDSILARLSKGESVMRADVTRREKPLLEHLHKGGNSAEWFSKNLVVNNSGELQYQMVNELSHVNKRLQSVEGAIINSHSLRTINMNVEHDDTLNIRARDRYLKVRRARA